MTASDTVDLLTAALAHVRPMLDSAASDRERLQILWAAAKNARELASNDVWEDEFMTLGTECGLVDRVGAKTVQHVLGWAWRNDNPPFEARQT
jgi:hypothetical protein